MEAKVLEFINLSQENISVKEYEWNFTQFARYYTTMVVKSKERMSKFVLGVSEIVVKECRATILNKEMEISCVMINSQQTGEDNIKERSREAKRENTGDGYFS